MNLRIRTAILLVFLIAAETTVAQNADYCNESCRAAKKAMSDAERTKKETSRITTQPKHESPRRLEREPPEQGVTHWLDWDTSYDPGSAYISSLDAIPTPGTATVGDWTSEVTLTPDGRFRSASMSTQVTLLPSFEPVRITASCDFAAPPTPGRTRPDVTMTVTYSPKLTSGGSALRGIELRLDRTGPSSGIAVWTIGPQSAVAGQQEWPVGQMLPSQFFEVPTQLWFDYDKGVDESAEVSRNGFRPAFARLVPCWSYTAFWDQQYRESHAARPAPASVATTAPVVPGGSSGTLAPPVAAAAAVASNASYGVTDVKRFSKQELDWRESATADPAGMLQTFALPDVYGRPDSMFANARGDIAVDWGFRGGWLLWRDDALIHISESKGALRGLLEDGTLLVMTGIDPPNCYSYLLDPAGNRREVQLDGVLACAIAASPDGRHLLFRSTQRELYERGPDGRPRQTTDIFSPVSDEGPVVNDAGTAAARVNPAMPKGRIVRAASNTALMVRAGVGSPIVFADADDVRISGMNDREELVGTYWKGGHDSCFMRNASGRVIDLNFRLGMCNAYAILHDGTIIGSYLSDDGCTRWVGEGKRLCARPQARAFVWHPSRDANGTRNTPVGATHANLTTTARVTDAAHAPAARMSRVSSVAGVETPSTPPPGAAADPLTPPAPWKVIGYRRDRPVYFDPTTASRSGDVGHVATLNVGTAGSTRREIEVMCSSAQWRVVKSESFRGVDVGGAPVRPDKGPQPWQAVGDPLEEAFRKAACGS